MLKIKNLSKKYNNKTIVDHINLNIQFGSITLLLGQSGVGKSTVLRILAGLEKPDTGTMILSQGTKMFHEDFLKQKDVGMVFQHFNLFDHLTILENITLPLIKVAKKSVQEARDIADALLKSYDLSQKADLYPADLSGGQKQRVALARTLAMKPKVICLDEPTSALDPKLTTKIAQNITELAQQNYIVIIATHDTDLIKQIDCNIHLMKDGKIIESASSKEVAAEPNQYPEIKNFTLG